MPPPQAAREAAQGGNGGQAPAGAGGVAAKGGGASASRKEGELSMFVFYSTAGATARAASPTPRSGVGAVKLVGRRAPRYRFTARRAHFGKLPRHKTRPHRIVVLRARKCRCGLCFFDTRGARGA